MRTHVAGLAPNDGGVPELPNWYLLESTKARVDMSGKKSVCIITFRIAQGAHENHHFVEKFFLTDAAITRLRCFLSRSGYPGELLESGDLDDDYMTGLRVWALLKLEQYQGEDRVTIDGWNMRPEKDGPPAEAPQGTQEPARDYEAEDRAALEAEGALEGI